MICINKFYDYCLLYDFNEQPDETGMLAFNFVIYLGESSRMELEIKFRVKYDC